MTATLDTSFKKRLQLIAKERNLTPAVVWQNVIADRFLVRLCKSRYRSNFVLKGGTLLAKHLEIGRETMDLDFSVLNLNQDVKTLCKALEEIIAIPVDDGFEFRNVKAENLNHFHMNYPGTQVRIEAGFGSSKFTLFIDLGFGDHVEEKEENILLLANSKGPLFETDINLVCYPIEFVFAEKLETVIYRGAENSRMKDFHDLFTMVSDKKTLDSKQTFRVITTVFEHRGTSLSLPLAYDEASLNMLQSHWQRYRAGLALPDSVPSDFKMVIAAINDWSKT